VSSGFFLRGEYDGFDAWEHFRDVRTEDLSDYGGVYRCGGMSLGAGSEQRLLI
jgi:hypothetical protein